MRLLLTCLVFGTIGTIAYHLMRTPAQPQPQPRKELGTNRIKTLVPAGHCVSMQPRATGYHARFSLN